MDKKEEIWEIIAGRIHGEMLSPEEEQAWQCWLEENPANRGFYDSLEDFYRNARIPGEQGITETDKAYGQNLKNIKVRRITKTGRWWRYGKYAAIGILSAGLAWAGWKYSGENDVPQTGLLAKTIVHGTSRGVLTLASGESIDLQARQMTIREKAGMIRNEKGVLQYTALKDKKNISFEYNTLDIPRGGEYQLKLEDGTQVWLNADSRLRYPVCFGQKERRIYLEGEAYFQVARDTTRPFIVSVGGTEVTALGTEFNILSNSKNKTIYTTLVKGAVKVRTQKGDGCILKPSQQAVISDDENLTEVRQVKISLYTSWKDGYYTFEQQPLEEIMGTLSRWYDIQVFYLNKEVAGLRFSGRLKRYENIDNLLTMIKLTHDVDFEIKGKTIIVKNGKNRKY